MRQSAPHEHRAKLGGCRISVVIHVEELKGVTVVESPCPTRNEIEVGFSLGLLGWISYACVFK